MLKIKTLLICLLFGLTVGSTTRIMADDLPIKPSQFVDGFTFKESSVNPEQEKANSEFRTKIYLIVLAVIVISTILTVLLRSVLFLQENAIKAYFTINLKPYSHAFCVGDETGIAHGRYRLRFPKLFVGEVEFDVRGSSLKNGHILVLRDGVMLEFYDGDAMIREQEKQNKEQRVTERLRLAANHPEDLRLQPSIFDKEEEEYQEDEEA